MSSVLASTVSQDEKSSCQEEGSCKTRKNPLLSNRSEPSSTPIHVEPVRVVLSDGSVNVIELTQNEVEHILAHRFDISSSMEPVDDFCDDVPFLASVTEKSVIHQDTDHSDEYSSRKSLDVSSKKQASNLPDFISSRVEEEVSDEIQASRGRQQTMETGKNERHSMCRSTSGRMNDDDSLGSPHYSNTSSPSHRGSQALSSPFLTGHHRNLSFEEAIARANQVCDLSR